MQSGGIDSCDRPVPFRAIGHLLRHTVANEGLKNGASLEQIGQLLRHEQLSTTTIYAKVDYERLRLVARPWISGGAQ